jgi:2-keto-3-deoxy-L-rhamnonate aldolase RhmA
MTFRERFIRREFLFGTFLKTPTSHAAEILGLAGFDFVTADAEHAALDRQAVELMILASRASGAAALVRVLNSDPSSILSALDCGATGLVIPHVSSAAKAREVSASARYRHGRRGYSSSPRSAAYGAKTMWKYIDEADAQTVVIAQIEDPEALDEVDAIAAVDGIDGLFIGRGDLTAAYGAPSNDAPVVRDAVARVSKAAGEAGKPVAVFAGTAAEAAWLKDYGATTFFIGSDQSFLRRSAGQALDELKKLVSSTG